MKFQVEEDIKTKARELLNCARAFGGEKLAADFEHPGYAPLTKPSQIHGNDPDWKMKIDAQEGGSFSGTLTGPNGRPQTILGTLQRDGKHFVFSTNDDMGSGMVGDDELEYCWSTSSQRFLGTGCATYKRNK